ncbi:MAG: APC family permease, partial [Rhodanobacteraceae bacterium]
ASPGAGGVNLDWLNPGNSPTGHGFFLAIVFAIFAIGGWDAAAPIGEESRNPRRNVPRGVIGSILILGAFLVFASWGQLSGWGTLHADKLAASPELPAFVLGHKYWGGAWIILLIALLNSSLAVSIAVTNASVRIFYAMARSGVLPRQMSVVHPKHKTPVNAIIFQTAVNLVLGVGLAFAVGQNNVYNVTGLMATFALAPVLIVANVGMTVFYWRDHRQDFNVLKHVLVPIVSSAALVLVVYYSLNPAPAYPASLAAPITIGWLVLGLGVLFTMLRLGKRAWLVHAGAAVAEEPLH